MLFRSKRILLSDEMDIREKLLNKHESRFGDIVSNGKEARTLHLGCHTGVALVVSFGVLRYYLDQENL